MPSVTHEALVDLFKNRPTLAAEALHHVLGQPIPTFMEARVELAPELVVLSAMAHGQSEVGEAIGVAFLAAAGELDEERRAVSGDLVLSSLNEAARRRLEAMMKSGYQFQSDRFLSTALASGRHGALLEPAVSAKAPAAPSPVLMRHGGLTGSPAPSRRKLQLLRRLSLALR